MLNSLPQIFTSFLISGLFILLSLPLAIKIGLVDKPGGHKTHSDHIPVVGGLGIFLGLVVSLWAFSNAPEQNNAIILAALILLTTGMLDDKYFLSHYTRFGAQIGAAAILVLADNTVLHNLGYLFDTETLTALNGWSIPLTIFATVGVINAVNMTDGLDGLAGGLSLVTLASITILFLLAGVANTYVLVPLLTMSAILGFLLFNFRTPWLHKAKVFMGNGGSMLLGIIIAWLLIKFSQLENPAFSPVTALWLFAIPLMDTVCIMLRRMKKGQSPFAADREHLHHLFLAMGFSVQQAVVLVVCVASMGAVLGLASELYGVADHWLFYAFLLMFVLYFAMVDTAWKKQYQTDSKQHPTTPGSGVAFLQPVKHDKIRD